MRKLYPVSVSCGVLEVSASGYFNWLRRRESGHGGAARRHSDEALLAYMRAIHAEVKGEYGWPRMHKELLARGIRVGKDRVRKLMQQHGIRAKTKRKFVVTTDSRHSLPVAPDLVQRRFNPEAPNQLCSGDITYIQTDEGWLYLAAVIDLFNRQVVGWSLQPHMQASLVKDALAMAWWRRRPPPGLVFHSDRGSQYCSHEFQDALKGWGVRSSMSRKGNCWDNAPTESFWGRLKTASVQQISLAGIEPALGCSALALGAVSVAAGVVGDQLGGAAIAAQHMSPQCRCAALLNGRHDLELRQAQVTALAVTPGGTMLEEDVGDLQSGPLHARTFRRQAWAPRGRSPRAAGQSPRGRRSMWSPASCAPAAPESRGYRPCAPADAWQSCGAGCG